MRLISRTSTLITVALVAAGTVGLSAQRGQRNQRPRGPAAVVMSGTYQLVATRGDDARRVADQATRDLPRQVRDRVYQRLLDRLQPPDTIAVDRQGRTVTMVSSAGPRAVFDADGRDHREMGPEGHAVVTHAEFSGDRLTVTTSGNRDTDFLVSLEPLDDGATLLVTRRFDDHDLRGPVTIQCYYRRIASTPRWDLYAGDRGLPPPPPPPRLLVPEGTRILAVLDSPLSTRTLRGGEQFSMTVRSPSSYAGARIDAVVARVTPYGPGRNADLAIDFNTIRFRNGESGEFAAVLDTVRLPNGTILRVNASGEGTGTSATNTAIGGGIGAAIGAVIGSLAGGGKGAAVGAVVGGVSGAIVAQDRQQYLDLPPGTEVTLSVRAPRR